jgi:hypothetical protein
MTEQITEPFCGTIRGTRTQDGYQYIQLYTKSSVYNVQVPDAEIKRMDLHIGDKVAVVNAYRIVGVILEDRPDDAIHVIPTE